MSSSNSIFPVGFSISERLRQLAASLLIGGAVVVSTATTADASTRTFKAAPVDSFWSNPANWQEGVAPIDGDDLVFPQPSGPAQLVRNDIAGLQVRSLSFVGSYFIQGQPFGLGAGGLHWGGSGPQGQLQFETPLTLLADQTWDMQNFTTIEVNATVALNGHTWTLEGAAPAGLVLVAAPISGDGGIILNSGELRLVATNTYTGQTIINGGVLELANETGLGVGDATLANGTLLNAGSIRMTTPAIGFERIRFAGGTSLSRSLGDVVSLATFEVTGDANINLSPVNGTFYLAKPVEFTATGLASLPKLTFIGGIELQGATLVLNLPAGFVPAVGQTFVIFDNTSAAAITGTFAGLPEGATLTHAGVTVAISYTGGTGNDIVLTVTDVVKDYYLSEGATGVFFTTDILLANPSTTAAPITVTFLKSDGAPVVQSQTLPAQSRRTIRVNTVAGMENTAFSTVVRSDDGLPIVVERTMSWDATGYGSHTEHAVDGPSSVWYFAEGSQGFFHTYVLLTNPNLTANSATVQYLFEGEPALTRTYELAPSSRYTIDIGADQALRDKSFGMTVTFDQPGSAERSMYFGMSPLWQGGHESVGVTAPATSWFLAEGATGTFFETFVLLANPNPSPVTATLTFLPADGQPVTREKSIPANGRVTVNIEQEDASLASAAVATTVSASSPIIVERSQYWPDPAPRWYEAHNSFGVKEAANRWGLAEGRVGGSDNAQTYILLANPQFEAANVQITFLRENGAPVTKSFTVQPRTRFNVAVAPASPDVPELANERFGAVIESSQPIIVERALYWDASSLTWSAGSNATATRLP